MKSKIKFLAALSLAMSLATTKAANYEIGTWEDFKDCAITFTFDDCLKNQFSIAVPILNDFHYKGSFFLVTNWMGNQGFSWDNAREMSNAGHEIGSHTVSHANLNTGNYINEMSQSKSTIETQIGKPCKTIVYPNCVTPSSEKECEKYYIGGRICNNNVVSNKPYNYFQLGSIICGNTTKYNSTETLTKTFEEAKNSKGWCVLLIHEIDNGSGYSPLSSTVLKESLMYLKSNDKSYWVATFGDAIEYSKERSAATIKEVKSSSSSLELEIKDNLDDKLYNYPLSLRTALPGGWTEIVVTQDGKEMKSSIKDGYIYFQGVPDAGTIVIEPKVTEPLPTGNFSKPDKEVSVEAGSTYSVAWSLSDVTNNSNVLSWEIEGNKSINVLSAEASSEWTNEEGTFSWKAENILTKDTTSRWSSGAKTFAGEWVMLNLDKQTIIAGASISENTAFGAISEYEIQYDNGDNIWKTAYEGTTIGISKDITFPAVNAKRIRFYVTSAENININYITLSSAKEETLKSSIGESGSYDWTIPTEYTGLSGKFVLSTSKGAVITESSPISIIEKTETNIEENKPSKVVISPNPAKGFFKVETDDDILSIKLMDFKGRLIKSQKESMFMTNDIAKGLYLVIVITAKGEFIEKVSIQ